MFMEESCLTGSSRVKVPLGWRVRVASRVVSTALSAIDSLSPDSRQNRTPTVILTAAALALTASVRSSSSETRTAPVRLPVCFKDFVIFKNRPFQPQRRLCAFQNGTRRNLSPQK